MYAIIVNFKRTILNNCSSNKNWATYKINK